MAFWNALLLDRTTARWYKRSIRCYQTKIILIESFQGRIQYISLAPGEGDRVVFGFDSLAAPTAKAGAHIRPVILKEGVIVTSTFIQLVKNATHTNAGELFINFVLSLQGYELLTTTAHLGLLRRDVPDLSVTDKLKPFKILANTIEDEVQINENMRDGVAAKALVVQQDSQCMASPSLFA